MDISQTQQDTTEGKLPHGKEPEPSKDQVVKIQERKKKKRRKVDDFDLKDYVEKVNQVYRSYNVPKPFTEKVDETQKVDSTKGKLPHGKEPEPFKEFDKIKWPRYKPLVYFMPDMHWDLPFSKGKNPLMFDESYGPVKDDGTFGSDSYDSDDSDEKTTRKRARSEVDETQKVDSTKEKLPRGKEREPFQELVLKNMRTLQGGFLVCPNLLIQRTGINHITQDLHPISWSNGTLQIIKIIPTCNFEVSRSRHNVMVSS